MLRAAVRDRTGTYRQAPPAEKRMPEHEHPAGGEAREKGVDMDLKTYAVGQKLLHDDGLLDYVVRQEPVPVDVVAASFRDFLDRQEDAQARKLIDDYRGFLGEAVPVVITRNQGTGGYQVSGEIPDSMVSAIMLVHNLSPEAVIKSLVDQSLCTVHGQKCEIVECSMEEAAERTRMKAASIPEVSPVPEASPVPDGGTETPHEADAPAPAGIEAGTPAADDVFGDVPDDIPDVMDIQEPASLTEDPEGMDIQEPASLTEEPEGVDIPGEEPAPQPDPPVGEPEAQTRDFAAIVQSIYEKFCSDLRAYGLDKRLNLAI